MDESVLSDRDNAGPSTGVGLRCLPRSDSRASGSFPLAPNIEGGNLNPNILQYRTMVGADLNRRRGSLFGWYKNG